MKNNLKKLWFTDIAFVLLTIASFTAILIPSGRVNPSIMGVPYTVWMGILFCIIYIILAYIASILQREDPDEN